MTGIGLRLRGSLRWRLMVGTVVAIGIALVLSGVTLAALFRDAMLRQFQDGLERQLDQILAQVDIDEQGALKFDARALSDPRWERPYSGLYWQIDRGESRGVMRSRSLWDVTLSLPQDTLADGRLHVHAGTGPRQAPVMMFERSLHAAPEGHWRAVVAGDARDIDVAAARFDRMLLLSLGVAALCCLGFGMSSNFTMLLLLAFGIGFGQGLGGPIGNAALFDVAPPHRSGEALGVRTAVMMSCQTVLPLLAGTATVVIWYLFPLAESLDLSVWRFRGALAATWIVSIILFRWAMRREPPKRISSWLIDTHHRTGLIWFERGAFLLLMVGWYLALGREQAAPAPLMLAFGLLVLIAR